MCHRKTKSEAVAGNSENINDIQWKRLCDAIGPYLANENNPLGVWFYFDSGKEKPWRIADDTYSESFERFEQLIEAAHSWRIICEDGKYPDWNRKYGSKRIYWNKN